MTVEPESTVCPEWPLDATGQPLPLSGTPIQVRAILDAQRAYEAVQALGGSANAERWARHAFTSSGPEYDQALREAAMSERVGGPLGQVAAVEEMS
jgi:hypothetical protein